MSTENITKYFKTSFVTLYAPIKGLAKPLKITTTRFEIENNKKIKVLIAHNQGDKKTCLYRIDEISTQV